MNTQAEGRIRLLVAAGRTYRGRLILRTAAGVRVQGEEHEFQSVSEAMAFIDALHVLAAYSTNLSMAIIAEGLHA